jgi:glycine oxidase
VIVIGAGIIGCAIARELSVRGIRCTVIDPRPIGGGATQASAGMLAPYVEAHGGGPMLDLCVRSLAMYESAYVETLRNEGFEIDYELIGTLQIALSAAQAATLRHGVRGGWLQPDAIAETYPFLCPTFGAFTSEDGGYVDPPQLTRALAGSAERHGAAFRRGRVEAISPAGDGVRVVVDGEPIAADRAVLAAGAWTNQIEGIRRPLLRPVRGQLLKMRSPSLRLVTIMWGPDCYIVPRYNDGTLLVGATVEEAGFDERTTEEGVNGLLAAAQRLIPALTADKLIEARVGLRPAAPDDLPVLGRDPEIPGLIHASGHYRNGVLLAPITGRLIADLVEGKPGDPALKYFAADRF